MDLYVRVDVNCGRKDGSTDGRTENRTPVSHLAKGHNNKCDKVALKQHRRPLIQQQSKRKWKLFKTIQHQFMLWLLSHGILWTEFGIWIYRFLIVTCILLNFVTLKQVTGINTIKLFVNQLQWNFDGSNTDGSFTTAVSNSFLGPLELSHSCRFGMI